jgi:NADH:ubiquinone oxidoreductase subunit 3 (subunit A)
MPYACTTCGQRYEPEPGYYFGAMFISYGLSCVLLLPIALILNIYTELSVNGIMAIIIFIGAVLFMRILRLSRSLWIHIMIRYDPNAITRYNARKKKKP